MKQHRINDKNTIWALYRIDEKIYSIKKYIKKLIPASLNAEKRVTYIKTVTYKFKSNLQEIVFTQYYYGETAFHLWINHYCRMGNAIIRYKYGVCN